MIYRSFERSTGAMNDLLRQGMPHGGHEWFIVVVGALQGLWVIHGGHERSTAALSDLGGCA